MRIITYEAVSACTLTWRLTVHSREPEPYTWKCIAKAGKALAALVDDSAIYDPPPSYRFEWSRPKPLTSALLTARLNKLQWLNIDQQVGQHINSMPVPVGYEEVCDDYGEVIDYIPKSRRMSAEGRWIYPHDVPRNRRGPRQG